VRASTAFALLALFATGSASADDAFTPAGARAAALYVAVPLGARDRRAAPVLGLRIQEYRLGPSGPAGAASLASTRTVLDVPLLAREDDPLRDSGAKMLLGKGMIVGIVVGALVAASLISDDDDDGY
jgi:hypothetical protein